MPKQTIKDLREQVEFLEGETRRLDDMLWESAFNAAGMMYWIYASYGMEAATKAAVDLGIIDKLDALLLSACQDQQPS